MTENDPQATDRHVFDAMEADHALNALIKRTEAGETIRIFRDHQLVACLLPIASDTAP